MHAQLQLYYEVYLPSETIQLSYVSKNFVFSNASHLKSIVSDISNYSDFFSLMCHNLSFSICVILYLTVLYLILDVSLETAISSTLNIMSVESLQVLNR